MPLALQEGTTTSQDREPRWHLRLSFSTSSLLCKELPRFHKHCQSLPPQEGTPRLKNFHRSQFIIATLNTKLPKPKSSGTGGNHIPVTASIVSSLEGIRSKKELKPQEEERLGRILRFYRLHLLVQYPWPSVMTPLHGSLFHFSTEFQPLRGEQ